MRRCGIERGGAGCRPRRGAARVMVGSKRCGSQNPLVHVPFVPDCYDPAPELGAQRPSKLTNVMIEVTLFIQLRGETREDASWYNTTGISYEQPEDCGIRAA